MNVLYDITCLGSWHEDERQKTGVFRVAHEVGRGLAVDSRCALRCCAHSRVIDAAEYLKANQWAAGTPFVHSAGQQRVSAAAKPIRTAIERTIADRRLTRRAARRLGSIAISLTDGVSTRLPNETLEWAQIYHSPVPEIAPQLQRRSTVKLPKFVTVYDMVAFIYPEHFEAAHASYLRKKLSALRDAWVLCISEATKNDFIEHTRHDPARVFVTTLAAGEQFHAVADERLQARAREASGIPPGDYFLSLCTLEPRKNLDLVIRSFAAVVRERELRTTNLVLVGNTGWKTEKIVEALREYPELQDRIILTGFVPDEQLAALYSGAIGFIYMSHYEGFGLPPLEAMKCGVPVIASNTSSLPEVVADAGLLLDPGDRDGLCQAMIDLASKPDVRADLAARALARSSLFSWQKTVDATIAAYQIALRRG